MAGSRRRKIDLYYYYYYYLLFSRAIPLAYGSSQARGRIRATATATPDLGCVCKLHHSSRQCQILNPLSKSRDRTCVLVNPSHTRLHCSRTGKIDLYIWSGVSALGEVWLRLNADARVLCLNFSCLPLKCEFHVIMGKQLVQTPIATQEFETLRPGLGGGRQ